MANDSNNTEEEIFAAMAGNPVKMPRLHEYLEVIITDLESVDRELRKKKYYRKRLFPWIFGRYESPPQELRQITMALSTAKNALALLQKKKASTPDHNPYGITVDDRQDFIDTIPYKKNRSKPLTAWELIRPAIFNRSS